LGINPGPDTSLATYSGLTGPPEISIFILFLIGTVIVDHGLTKPRNISGRSFRDLSERPFERIEMGK
jgi:hypothetical protein